MSELNAESLTLISQMTQLNGSADEFSTPWFYRAIMRVAPPLVRTVTNVHYNGLERIPQSGPVIITGNHTSHIDPIVKIMGMRRPVHYLAKEEFFEDKKLQKLMASTGQIETERKSGASDALSTAVDVLENGHVMGIFPEGTRSRNLEPPYLGRGKTGVARLAARFPNVPIVPMAIIGARDFLKPGSAIVNPLAKIQVSVGNPITFAEWLNDKEGAGLDNEGISNIASLDEHGQRSIMKSLYRDFTDQLIETLRILGAP